MAISTIGTDALASAAVTQPKMATNVSGTAPAFSAYMNTNQTISASTYTKVAFNTENFDTNSLFDTSTSRFTPNIAGYYLITCACWFETFNSGPWAADLCVNGSAKFTNSDYANSTYVGPHNQAVTGLVYLNGSTDYVEMYCYVGGSGSQTIYGTNTRTYIHGTLVRAA